MRRVREFVLNRWDRWLLIFIVLLVAWGVGAWVQAISDTVMAIVHGQ